MEDTTMKDEQTITNATDDTDECKIVKRRGGYFVTAESWSGPWETEDAANKAKAGDFDAAHRIERALKAQAW
jgi:hypothetical protein